MRIQIILSLIPQIQMFRMKKECFLLAPNIKTLGTDTGDHGISICEHLILYITLMIHVIYSSFLVLPLCTF
jgi:hypothetical protein